MPTITTTVTSAAASGVVTTQTTTEATPGPPPAVAAAPAVEDPPDTGAYAATVGTTGSAGFIGSETIKQLLGSGYSVRAGVRAGEDTSHLAKLAASSPGKIEFFINDLTDDGSFDECMSGCDAVIHLAATVNVWEKDPYAEIINPMVNGVKNVLGACVKAGVKRVVFASSTFSLTNWMAPTPPVNGKLYTEEDWSNAVTEEMIHGENGFDAYAAGKPRAEKAAWAFAEENGLDMVVINPGIVFGPPVAKGGLTSAIFAAAATTPDPFLVGGTFAAIDVRDIAKAMLAAFENPDAKGRYHITHCETFDQEMYNRYVGEAFPKLGIKPFPDSASKVVIDNSRCTELIGSLISIKKMCLDTARASLANGMMSYP